jgi:hypothetical protein
MEAEHLRKLRKELQIPDNELEEIEVLVMGASLEKVLRQQEAWGRRDLIPERAESRPEPTPPPFPQPRAQAVRARGHLYNSQQSSGLRGAGSARRLRRPPTALVPHDQSAQSSESEAKAPQSPAPSAGTPETKKSDMGAGCCGLIVLAVIIWLIYWAVNPNPN